MLHRVHNTEALAYQQAWGEALMRPACIADRAARLVWQNQPFRNLVATSEVCRDQDDHLTLSDRIVHAGFLKFLAGLEQGPAVFLARHGHEQAYLMFRCEPVRPPDRPAAIAIMVFDSRRVGDAVWGDIGEVFALTASEATIARRLVDGTGLSRLAHDLGITPETAKTHLRRIYVKLGVGSREEFFARLLPFRVD